MKKTLTIIFIFVTLFCEGQFYTGAGIGLNINKVVPVGDLHFGFRAKSLFIQGGYLAHINNHDPAIFYYGFGKRFWAGYSNKFEVGGGYSHSLVTFDDKSRNSSGGIIYAAYIEELSDNCELTYGVHYIKNNFIPSITMRFVFTRN